MNSAAALDAAQARAGSAQAEVKAAQAALELLLRGTRAEQLAQTEAAHAAAVAKRDAAALERDRLTIHAPRAGVVDALPVELGDLPARGQTVATLLVGDAAWVRAYVPVAVRAQLAVGARVSVEVEGIKGAFAGTVRAIAQEPAFTPYYALVGEDASRLAFVAEIALQDPRAASLPAGLPARVTLRAP